MIVAPLVSVYVTSHNYGRYISRAVESVLNQTLRDFELIIIDDGSTDDSRDIIATYADRPEVSVILQENKGLNVTNNIALRAARGKYLMRLDADDWLDENALSVMSGILERQPEVGLVFPDYYLVDEAGTVTDLVRRHDFSEVTLLDQPAHGACTMIRRQSLLDLGGYSEDFTCQDGYELWIRFIEHHQVRNVNLPLFYYRQHGSNLTRNENRILSTRAEIIARHDKVQRTPMKTVAIVPVRGGTKGRGAPALEPLAGKALIDWTIEPALAAQQVSAVVVSSPDEAILAYVSARYGDKVHVVRRAAELARPNTHIEGTVFDALASWEQDGRRADAVMMLYVEAPFRRPEHLDTAVDVMALFDTDVVIPVRMETDIFHRHDGNGLTPLVNAGALRLEREELFREVGLMRLVRRDYLDAKKSVTGDRVGHFVLEESAAVSITSDWTWSVVRWHAEKLLNSASVEKVSS